MIQHLIPRPMIRTPFHLLMIPKGTFTKMFPYLLK